MMSFADNLQLEDSRQLLTVVIVGLALLAILIGKASSTKESLPIVGSNALFGYVGALRTVTGLPTLLTEGHYKYNSGAFRIPSLRGWLVVVSGKHVDELRRAPDDTLSIIEELNDLLAARWTLGSEASDDPYHVGVIRKQLTSNLGPIFPAVYDEIKHAFDDELLLPDNGGWIAIKAHDLVMHVVCRATNRLFIGLPLCRDAEYTKISRDFTLTVVLNGAIISLFPRVLRSLVGNLISTMPAAVRRFERYLVPIIERRQKMTAELGDDWNEKPNDMLQWLMDSAQGKERTPVALTRRMLVMNFAAVHTSSMTATYALYNLAAYPQFVSPLREEVERVVKEHGWTKDALTAMIRLDSFIRETMRISGVGLISLQRKAIKPFKFSDGTSLSSGAHVSANMYAIHRDASLYPSPETFDPFRFSRLIEEGQNAAKNSFTATSPEYLTWGHGAHACPGRFFASQEIKAMLAHIVLYYDVRMPEAGVRPADKVVFSATMPDTAAEILFRKRQSVISS